MVKLQGPLHAALASGTIARSVTFGRYRQRPWARRRASPPARPSALQASHRAMVRFLRTQWPKLPADARATWSDHYLARQLTPYHAYQSENLHRWRNFKPPSIYYPAPENDLFPFSLVSKAQTGPGYADCVISTFLVRDAWGIVLFHHPETTFEPSLGTVAAVYPHPPYGYKAYTDSQLQRGLWYWQSRAFTFGGFFASSYGTVNHFVP